MCRGDGKFPTFINGSPVASDDGMASTVYNHFGSARRFIVADTGTGSTPPQDPRGFQIRGYNYLQSGTSRTDGSVTPERSLFMSVFGPVPSRRLGRSLGVDTIPAKACSYSCVY